MSATIAPGDTCPSGGISVDSGIDENHNGILDADEVDATQYVCNGDDGLSTLVLIRDEAAGANCAAGGNMIEAGQDANANGSLEATEVGSTAYICDGSAGAASASGYNSLVSIVPEVAGVYCTYGGSKVSSGIDTDRNNVLDTTEVTASNYVCNGAPGPGVTWVDVTGTSVQAASNTGYMAHNDTAQVAITLPAAPTYGDIIQISGVGAGGWKVVQNTGQSIVTQNVIGNIGGLWIARDSDRQWQSVATSADGVKLVAAVNGGQIYTSTDSGATWTARDTGDRNWTAVASSASGNILMAGSPDGSYSGVIGLTFASILSTDSGLSWMNLYDLGRDCTAVAISATGAAMVVAGTGEANASTDSGLSWTRSSLGSWVSATASADGSWMAVGNDTASVDYYYSPTGWSGAFNIDHQTAAISSLASSADFSRLVATLYGGRIYTATMDPTQAIGPGSIPTWTAHDVARNWIAVASSADGKRLLAAEEGGQLYTSSDFGTTWIPRDSPRNWSAVASSDDGRKLVAVEMGGRIYTSGPTTISNTTSGTAGYISGGQYDAVDLQYIGNDTFMVRGYVGDLQVQ
ncbi:MAG: hypothetical protein KJ634_14525 [Gammaproteobacteria bacterium]|nr:hypothetical protein [Gammaproteobacteria bacterium]MBU1416829.1 hypothetical protein [Gammaproteobacteria bacterium]